MIWLAVILYFLFGVFISSYMIRDMLKSGPETEEGVLAFFWISYLLGWPIIAIGAFALGLGWVLKTVLRPR